MHVDFDEGEDPAFEATPLERYLAQMDISMGAKGRYRLTPTYQALADDVYASPMFRLAQLESKPLDSIRYRTASQTTDLETLNTKLWLRVGILLGRKDDVVQDGFTIDLESYKADFEHVFDVMCAITLHNSCTGIKHIFLDVKGFTYFVYSKDLYPGLNNNTDTSPRGVRDLQDYLDLVSSLTN